MFVVTQDPLNSNSVFTVGSGAIWWFHPGNVIRVKPPEGPPVEPPPATIQLSSCQYLDRSNTVYELTQDVKSFGRGSCFLMPRGLHDITIDGKNHTISYASHAIFGDDLENVSVRNLRINQIKHGVGNVAISLTHSRSITIENVSINVLTNVREGVGIRVDGILSDNTKITGSSISGVNFGGIAITVNGKAEIRNNDISVNNNGLGIKSVLSDAIIDGNRISIFNGFGIISSYSSGMSITGNLVKGVGMNNIILSNIDNSGITSNSIIMPVNRERGRHAFYLERSTKNVINNNTIFGGAREAAALFLESSSQNVVEGNTIESPQSFALDMDQSPGNLIQNNTINGAIGGLPIANQAPIVDAGPDQSIKLPASVSLTGTVYDDGLPNGTLNTSWSVTNGSGTVSFDDVSVVSTTAHFSTAGTYVLKLAASDGDLAGSGEVTLTVSSAPPSNQTPVVDAGPDQTITLPALVDLDSTVSDDNLPNGPLIITWSVVSGPDTVTFSDPANEDTMAAFSVAGSYVIKVEVSDGDLVGSDTIVITVNPA